MPWRLAWREQQRFVRQAYIGTWARSLLYGRIRPGRSAVMGVPGSGDLDLFVGQHWLSLVGSRSGRFAAVTFDGGVWEV